MKAKELIIATAIGMGIQGCTIPPKQQGVKDITQGNLFEVVVDSVLHQEEDFVVDQVSKEIEEENNRLKSYIASLEQSISVSIGLVGNVQNSVEQFGTDEEWDYYSNLIEIVDNKFTYYLMVLSEIDVDSLDTTEKKQIEKELKAIENDIQKMSKPFIARNE